MPMYDFFCQDCTTLFEELLVKDEGAAVCPQCGSAATTRMLSAPSPLKTGAFPFKPGPVHPMAARMAGGCGGGGGGCPSGGGGFS
jgi:putative FmdB family regulatory protein